MSSTDRTRRARTRAGLRTLVAAVGAATLAACTAATGADSTTTSSVASPDAASASAAQATEAEVLYLQRMARYTQQSQALADLARQRATSQEVRDLAATVRTDADAVSGDLAVVLQDLGASVPAPGSDEGAGWPGILTPRQMAALTAASPTELDRLWPAAMAQVSNEAVTLSQAASAVTDPARDRGLPQRIIAAVSAEYVKAMQLAGIPGQRATLPPR